MQIIKKIIGATLMAFVCHLVSAETDTLRLAITTTTENTGLMSVLNEAFEDKHKIKLNVVVTGSGQALRLGEQGDVDVLLTHAPEDEKKFIDAGHGLERIPVMQNDFVLLGPTDDPAGIKTAQSVIEAFQTIKQGEHRFISRGDQSGTHKKELAIWYQTGDMSSGDWYKEVGLGMGALLLFANDQQAYVLTDRGTYLGYKDKIDLALLYHGDAFLNNPYHIITVNPENHGHNNLELANKYIEFISGEQGQAIIDRFNVNGEKLFYPVLDLNNKAQSSLSVNTEQDTSVQDNNDSYFTDATLASFKLIFNFDKTLFNVVWTSLKVSLIAVLIASLISIPLGVVVALNSFRGKVFLMACLNTLMALPTVVVGLLLYGLLNRQGVFGDWGLLYTQIAMVIGQCVLIIPVIWNLSIAAVNGADPRLARTCLSLGANHLQRILIYMSEVRFALVAAVVVGFGRAIGEVGIAMMLGGNIDGYTRTMTTAIALETSKGDFEFALALGFMLLLIAFIVNALLQQFQLRAK